MWSRQFSWPEQTFSQTGVLAELHLTENLFLPQLQLLVTRASQRLHGPGWQGSRHLCLHSRVDVVEAVSFQKVADRASCREQRSPQECGSWRRWRGFESSSRLAVGLVFLPQKHVYLWGIWLWLVWQPGQRQVSELSFKEIRIK